MGKSVGEDMEELELLYHVGGNTNCIATVERLQHFLKYFLLKHHWHTIL